MTYAVQQDLIDRFGEEELIQLTDRADPPAEAIDATVVARALTDADDAINAALAVRYSLPLASVPKILIGYACDIARYRLYEDRVTEAVQRRFDDAMKFLRAVGKGEVSLGLDGAAAVPAQSGGPASDAGDRVFTVGRPSQGSEGTLDDYLG